MRSKLLVSALLLIVLSAWAESGLSELRTASVSIPNSVFPGLTGQELIDSLVANYKTNTVLSYDNARDTMYAVIDNFGDSLSCVYTDFTIYIDPQADPSTDAYNKGINAEHSWPQSKGASTGNANSDMHHLYPAKDNVNSSRGNNPFDEISNIETDTWYRKSASQSSIPVQNIDEFSEKDNDIPRFEPREDHKGNVARSMFYFYTMYKTEADAADPDFFNLQKNVLRKWNSLDLVDAGELDRNDIVAFYQNNKSNPFILDTTLVQRAYFPQTIQSTDPVTGFAASAAGETQVNLSWTKNAAGDDAMIVFNTNGSFSNPAENTTYSNGQSALGGTIIGRSAGTAYTHTNLSSATTYFYKIFSVNGTPGSESYSSGVTASATTDGGGTAGTIIITEIMNNPDYVSDSNGEWFEIYNTGSTVIDINGWSLFDNGVDSHTISNGGALNVGPYSYLVLGIDAGFETNGGVQVGYQYSGFLLSNSDDELILKNTSGETVDSIAWDGGPNWPDLTGISMELVDYVKNNNLGENWVASNQTFGGGDYGTPGSANSTISRNFDISATNTNYDFGQESDQSPALTINCPSGTVPGETMVSIFRSTIHPQAPAGNHTIKRYVSISPTTQPENATIVFKYSDEELNSLTESALWMYSWYNGAWHPAENSTVNTTANTITVTGITHFSDWTAGEFGDQTLPVTLSNFNILQNGQTIILNWNTASEIENSGFCIDRKSSDSDEFRLIASYQSNPDLAGLGNSPTGKYYEFADDAILDPGIYYYRLSSVDFNGQLEILGVREISFAPKQFQLLGNYPNPFNPATNIHFRLSDDGEVSVKIYNISGQLMWEYPGTFYFSGKHEITWDGTNHFGRQAASGVYIAHVEFSGNIQTLKMLLIR